MRSRETAFQLLCNHVPQQALLATYPATKRREQIVTSLKLSMRYRHLISVLSKQSNTPPKQLPDVSGKLKKKYSVLGIIGTLNKADRKGNYQENI